MSGYTYGGGSSATQTGLSYNPITGTDNADVLVGGTGSDFIKGKNGADIMYGGGGFDKLEGWSGADRFAFEVGNGYDTVVGFMVGQGDKILLPSNITYSQLSFESVTEVSSSGLGTSVGLNIIYGGQVWMRLEGFSSSTSTLAHTSFTYDSNINSTTF
jgi:Ca2+-binding RTX toxin-like protein